MSRNDEVLLRELHDEHAAVLTRYVTSLTGDWTGAEDIVQETLFRAWQHPAILGQEGPSVRAWLFTVARNLVIDAHRSARSIHEFTTDTLPERSSEFDTEALLDTLLVEDALASLSIEHRSVVVRAFHGGQSIAEIAAALGIPEGTVKSRMHYGMRTLRLALQERGVTR